MHDYSPLAVLGFVVLAIALGTALMFVLAWMEPSAPSEEATVVALDAGGRAAVRGETLIRPVSLALESGRKSIMKAGRNQLATG